jgi:hypothetical protein
MAGRVVVSTLNDDTGVLATQNGMTGVCKAWVNFNGQGTVSIRGSFNVSSITDVGTGTYRVNFTTALPNSNYATIVSASNNIGTSAGFSSFDSNDQNTTRTSIIYVAAPQTSVPYDPALVNVSVFSS